MTAKISKNHELLLVTENNKSIHYSSVDYIHIGPHNEAWAEEVIAKSSFVERWLAEKDNHILQLIPYVICVAENGKVFSYRRKSGGETRLEGKRSIGIGGHVNSDDKAYVKPKNLTLDSRIEEELSKTMTPNSWDVVLNGAVREINEEVGLDEDYIRKNLVEVGTMYTPTDGSEKRTQAPKVGEVHLGIIYKLTVPEDMMLSPDEGMIEPGFIDPYSLDTDDFEFWSQLVLGNLDKIKTL